MPRKTPVNPDLLLATLKTFEIFNADQTLKARSDPVWKDVCIKLENRITRNALNFAIRNNRWNLKTDLKVHFNLITEEVECIENVDISKESDKSIGFQPFNVFDNQNIRFPQLFFDLDLSEEEWRSIYPVSKIYREKGGITKTYTVLNKGWTDLIAKKCFLKTKVPCAYTFKYGKVFASEEAGVYLKIEGVCKECGAKINGFCLNKPINGNGITIRIHTYDTNGIPHNTKRAVKGETRTSMGLELLNKNARLWRNEAINEMSFGDHEPPYLPRSDTLRKIKEEATNLKLGIGTERDPIESIYNLKYEGKYAGYIKEIGKDRFYVFYWSPMQMFLYKDLIKQYKKIEIDATGSLIKSIVKRNGENRHIFLYQIIIKGEKEIQPLFQMVSEKQDTNFICYWLREILRDGAPIPPAVDCD